MRAKRERVHLMGLCPSEYRVPEIANATAHGFQLRRVLEREYKPKQPWENGFKMRTGKRAMRWHRNVPEWVDANPVHEAPRPNWVENLQEWVVCA